MFFNTENSPFYLHPRNHDMTEFCLYSNKFPLEDTITKGKNSRKVDKHPGDVLPQAALMHESEKDVVWFKRHFVGKRHLTFLSSASSPNPISSPSSPSPVAISFLEDKRDRTFKILVRTPDGSERRILPFAKAPIPSFWRRFFGPRYNPLTIIHRILPDISVADLQPCNHQNLPNQLLAIDERQIIRKFKFGVGYIPAGGNSESDVLSTEFENTSPSFKRFLQWIGDEITLKGWKGYRGGLDVKHDSTGTKAVYTSFHGNDIIYHVSPFLPPPTESSKKTYVERKRHLGNDMVLVLFQDRRGAKKFRLDTLRSHQNQVVFIVREAKGNPEGYEISIALKEGVPNFGPEMPNSTTILKRNNTDREWFLFKLIQADRACCRAPVFATKISRTRTILLSDVIRKYGR